MFLLMSLDVVAAAVHHLRMDVLSEARRAHVDQNWPKVYELLGEDTTPELGAVELSALADAAWWLGKLDESAAARERAFEARHQAGDMDAAALEAFFLSLALGDKGEDALASGWRSRAYRLAEQVPDSLTAGYLLSMESIGAYHMGHAEECVDKARATAELGRRHSDDTLVAWAIHVEGLGLVKLGAVDQGWARLDESMVAAVAGRLKPMWAGLMHCGMLVACEEYGDPRKAWQWVETTERWLATVPGAVVYPGVCRVHKVRIMQLRGTWPEAEVEARQACSDLLGVHAYTAARAYYEIAELKRLTGDHDAAYELYKQAHQLGWDPQPGLALLRLAQGRTDAAVAGLRRALDEIHDPLIRAGFLPHEVEVALAAGDRDAAERAADELAELASRYRSPLISTYACGARGAVLLAAGDARGAIPELRRAVAEWVHLDCSYELARVRALAGMALEEVGDHDGATLELEAAFAMFEQLGAEPDARRVRELLGGAPRPKGLSEREVEVLRLVAAGRSNKQIAADLFISENTVARHVQNIFAKLDVASRAAATSVAVKQGLT